MEKYDQQKVVGQGSFGKAILCKRKSDSKLCIIKQISLAKMSPKEAKLTEQEALLLSKLRHPNIVSFWESFSSKSQLHIVMEFADGGDLDNYIKTFSKANRGREMPERQVLNLFVQISLAIKHIHDRKILHRDLKSQNVFLTTTGLCKLGDFGVSKVLRNTIELAVTQIGTPYYMSPEIMDNQRYNSKTDIWSLGCILYELMCQRLPFGGQSMKQLCHNIAFSNPTPPPAAYSTEMRELVRDMLIKNPKNRPGINTVLARPVVQTRIAHFLGETKLQTEFNHTVLHGVDILRSVPSNPAAAVPPRPVVAPSAAAAAAPRSVAVPPSAALLVPRPSSHAEAVRPSHVANPQRAPSPVANPFAALAGAAPPQPPVVPSAHQIQQQKLDDQVAELRKLQAAAKAREEASRKASEALIAAENERLRQKAMARQKQEAIDAEKRAKEMREIEVLRKIREREAEMARIKAQQQQLINEQRLAAQKAAARKEAEAARLAQYNRVVKPAPRVDIPSGRPVVKAAPPASPVHQNRLRYDGNNNNNNKVEINVRGNGIASPSPSQPVVPSVVPVVRQQAAAAPAPVVKPSSKIDLSIPPYKPKASPSVGPVPVPSAAAVNGIRAASPSTPNAEMRHNVAGDVIQKAQDVMKLMEVQKQQQHRFTPQSPSTESSSSGGTNDESPIPSGKKPQSSPWFAQLADQMSDLQSQVKNIQAARSPQPPTPVDNSKKPAAGVAVGGPVPVPQARASPSQQQGRVSTPTASSSVQEASPVRAGAARVSYPQQPASPKVVKSNLSPGMKAGVAAPQPKKRLSDPPASMYKKPPLSGPVSGVAAASPSVVSKASVVSNSNNNANVAQIAAAEAAKNKVMLEQRKNERKNHQAGFKEFLKAQRNGQMAVTKPDMVFDVPVVEDSNEPEETSAEVIAPTPQLSVGPVPVPLSSSVKPAATVNKQTTQPKLSSPAPTSTTATSVPSKQSTQHSAVNPSLNALSAARVEALRQQHEQQRAEMKKMIQLQKKRMLEGHNVLVYGNDDSNIDEHNETCSDLIVQDLVYVASPVRGPPVHIAAVAVVQPSVVKKSEALTDDSALVDAIPVFSNSPITPEVLHEGVSSSEVKSLHATLKNNFVHNESQSSQLSLEGNKSQDGVTCCEMLTNCLHIGKDAPVVPSSPVRQNQPVKDEAQATENNNNIDEFSEPFDEVVGDDMCDNLEERSLNSALLANSFIIQVTASSDDMVIDDTAALEYSLMLNQMQLILGKPSVKSSFSSSSSAVSGGGGGVNDDHSVLDSIVEGEEDDDEFEVDSIEDDDDDDENNEEHVVELSENYSDDEKETAVVEIEVEQVTEIPSPIPFGSHTVLVGNELHTIEEIEGDDYAKTLFAELKHSQGHNNKNNDNDEDSVEDAVDDVRISPFSGHGTQRDVFTLTTTLETPHVMNIVTSHNENSYFKLTNNSYTDNLGTSDEINEELLHRVTHLRTYLSNQLGLEKFSQAMDFLSSLPVNNSNKVGSSSNWSDDVQEEDDDQLLNDLEQIIGEEGLHHLDDMFQLITLEDRLV